jgi:ERCC4-type nuclease
VLIERKTAVDFAQSLMDGRLFAQASRMAASPLRRPRDREKANYNL